MQANTKAKTISHCKGKGSLGHNNRTFRCKNVDGSRTADNITFVKQTIAEAYEECFGAAVERYNARQKRSDRKIDNYYKSVFDVDYKNTVVQSSDKRKSFYEDVVGIGDMHDTGVGTVDGKIAAECLTEYMLGFSKRNPNFHVFNAVLHLDEATPHLHIDYIPIGHYKRGVDTQNGMAQALMEMGYGHGKDSINKWRLAERRVLEEICNRHGINIASPKKGRGHTFTVEEYKERETLLKEIKLLTETKNELAEKLQAYENMEVAVDEVEVVGSKMPLGKTLISTADLDLLKEQSKAYCANKSRIDGIVEKEAEAEKSKRRADKEWLAAREEKQKYEQKNRETESLYNQQLDLNKRHKWATARIREMAEEKKSSTDKLQAEIQALSETVEKQKNLIAQAESQRASSVNQATASLTKRITYLEGELTAKDKLIAELKEAQQGAYYSVASVVNAARMLKYGDGDYKVNSLSPKQGILIDSMTDYAVYWARKDGLPDIADEMRQTLISEGLQDKINARTPKVYTGRKIG